jgi:hypothetical protein
MEISAQVTNNFSKIQPKKKKKIYAELVRVLRYIKTGTTGVCLSHLGKQLKYCWNNIGQQEDSATCYM